MKIGVKKLRNYFLLYLCFFIYSISTLCAKYASGQESSTAIFVFIVLEVFCLGVYALIWQQVLKRFSLVTAMASKGIVVIFNLIWSLILFKEIITIYNIAGAIIIMAGIWVVSLDG